jgi:hypothetical protein
MGRVDVDLHFLSFLLSLDTRQAFGSLGLDTGTIPALKQVDSGEPFLSLGYPRWDAP